MTALYGLVPEDSAAAIAVLPVALGAGVLTSRAVRPLRAGSRRAAWLALAATALLLVCGLVVAEGASVVSEPSDSDGPLSFAKGFAAGVGGSLANAVYDPWTGGPSLPVLLPTMLLMAGVVDGSSWGLWLRGHRRALVRSRLVRWPLVLLLSIVVISVSASTVDVLADARVPAEAFAVLALVPVLVLVGRGAVEVLRRPGRTDGLPPAWEPVKVRRRRFLTGRRLPLVLLLLTAASLAALAFFVASQAMLFAVEEVAASSSSITREALDALRMAMWGVSVLLLLGGYQLHTMARRSAALDAAALRHADGRRPLLYLRSFGDDDLEVPTHRSPRHSLFERLLSRRRERFEAMLTWHLWSFGPVVGVGRPRERLPRLGAAREYLSEEQWREQVERRITDALAIVVVLGRTEGLGWELRALRRLGAEGKTVLVVPPVDREELARRWRFCDEVMTEAGWPLLPAEDRPGALTAVLRRPSEEGRQDEARDSSWTVFAARDGHEWQYELAVEAALRLVDAPDAPGAAASTRVPAAAGRREAPARAMRARSGRLHLVPSVVGMAYVVAVVGLGSNGSTEHLNDVQAGDCVAGLVPDVVVDRHPHLGNRMELLPCREPHPYEVVASVRAVGAGGAFPGDDALRRFADDVCPEAVEDHVGLPVERTHLDIVRWLPVRLSWAFGDDHVVCGVADMRGPLTAPVAGIGR